jgi:hypothetical protein
MQNSDKMMASAIIAFEKWRQMRVNRAKTPVALQQQAVALLAHFSSSKITSALNVSGANLKRWSDLAQDKQSLTEFIALPPSDEPSSAPLNLALVFNNGANMRLCGELSPVQLTAIIQSVATS